MEGFVEVAKCELKGSDRGIELVKIDSYSFMILEDDEDFVIEEIEIWGVRKKFKARIFRPKRDVLVDGWDEVAFNVNDTFIELGAVEEAGELEYFV